jgi:hypothetical protein
MTAPTAAAPPAVPAAAPAVLVRAPRWVFKLNWRMWCTPALCVHGAQYVLSISAYIGPVAVYYNIPWKAPKL